MSILDEIIRIQEQNRSHRKKVSYLKLIKSKHDSQVNARLGFQQGKIKDNFIYLEGIVAKQLKSLDTHSTGDVMLDYCLMASRFAKGNKPYLKLPQMYKSASVLIQKLEDHRGDYVIASGCQDMAPPNEPEEYHIGIITKTKPIVYFSETLRRLYINTDKKQLHITDFNRTIENINEDVSPHPLFLLHPTRIQIGEEHLPVEVKLYLKEEAEKAKAG